MQEHKREELIFQIDKAFRNVPFPGLKIASDSNEVETFLGKRWQDVVPRDITPSTLYFFTLEAFHYYLPSFFLAIIKTPEKVDFMTVEYLIKKLQFGDWVKKKICKLFTKQQKAVIIDFLDNCESLYPSYQENFQNIGLQKAIDYWADC